MPEATGLETVTRQQRIWANLILVEGGFAPELEEESAEGQHEQKADHFRQGMKDTALPYGKSIPPEFEQALEKGEMLSATVWKSVLKGRKPPSPEYLQNYKDYQKNLAELETFPELEAELQEKLSAAYLLDVSTNPELTHDIIDKRIDDITDEFSLFWQREAIVKAAVRQVELEYREEGLTVLESPGNNPEHLEVSQKLEDFAKFESEFVGPKDSTEYTNAKAKHLYSLQAVAFKWIDRRTQQNLQPSADAVALADIIQRVHQEMMAVVIKENLPMPLSEENEQSLTDDEKEAIQQTWNNLVESQLYSHGEGRQISVKAPPQNGYLPSDADCEQFRIEMLSNFSRLLQIPSGRKLIAEINTGKHPVVFEGDHEDACRPTDETGHMVSAKGSASVVYMTPGEKDSDTLLSTENGGALFCPSFIALGHELVHALHNSQGRNRGKLPQDGASPLWNNREEYQTIFKGKFSEQTLRQQYGLSAERFGHSNKESGDPIYEAIDNLLKAEFEMIENDPQKVDATLLTRGFQPMKMVTELKLKVFASNLEGPVPEGWDLNQLTFEQLAEILRPKPLPAQLQKYGWKPYGLNRADMEEIYKDKEYHPLSEKGLRMRALGGRAALSAFDSFNTLEWETRIKLEPSKGPSWEDDLAALEAADQLLGGLLQKYQEPAVQKAAGSNTKLQRRIEKLVVVFGEAKTEFESTGAYNALNAISEFQNLFGDENLPLDQTNLFTKVHSLRVAKYWMFSKTQELTSAGVNLTGDLGDQIRIAAGTLGPKMEAEFESYGGDEGLAAIPDIMRHTETALKFDSKAPLFTKIKQCKEAEQALVAYASQSDVLQVKSISASDAPLHRKIEQIRDADPTRVESLEKMEDEFASYGGEEGLKASQQYLEDLPKLDSEAPLSTKVEQCREMQAQLERDASDSGFTEIKDIVASGEPLQRKVQLAEAFLASKEAEFESYGGEVGLKSIRAISYLTGIKLESDSDEELWTQIEQCKAAQAALEAYASKSGSPQVESIVASQEPLHKKIQLIQEAALATEQSKEET